MADKPSIPDQPTKEPTVNPVKPSDSGTQHPGTFKPDKDPGGHSIGPGEKIQTPSKK